MHGWPGPAQHLFAAHWLVQHCPETVHGAPSGAQQSFVSEPAGASQLRPAQQSVC